MNKHVDIHQATAGGFVTKQGPVYKTWSKSVGPSKIKYELKLVEYISFHNGFIYQV